MIELEDLDPDTRHSIRYILEKGWLPKYQTLGENGWPYLNPLIRDWKRYSLLIPDEPEEVLITAQDDATAIRVFRELYRLDEVPYIIREKIVTFRTIDSSIYEDA